MRASKREKDGDEYRSDGIHISGAETLCAKKSVHATAHAFIQRALTHPKGMPDQIVLTIEKLGGFPLVATLLPFSTIPCSTPDESRAFITKRLLDIGIKPQAIHRAFSILYTSKTMRGAALVDCDSGKRHEPDRQRGVRVSRLGLHPATVQPLRHRLKQYGIDTETVREALTLASKVLAHSAIVAEVCISDDPDYTTGYIATRENGYERILNVKPFRSLAGGRVFFLKSQTDIGELIFYLQKQPVLLTIGGRHHSDIHG